MRVPTRNLPAIVAEYFESVILPAASAAGGMAPLAAGIAGGLISRKIPEMVAQHMPALQALGVVDADGKIDIDLLHETARAALEKNPVMIAGYRPDLGDLDKLREIAARHQ